MGGRVVGLLALWGERKRRREAEGTRDHPHSEEPGWSGPVILRPMF